MYNDDNILSGEIEGEDKCICVFILFKMLYILFICMCVGVVPRSWCLVVCLLFCVFVFLFSVFCVF